MAGAPQFPLGCSDRTFGVTGSGGNDQSGVPGDFAPALPECDSRVIFGMVLFVVEVLFCFAWIYNRTGDASFLYSTAMLAVGVATVVFFVGSLVYRARKKGELA
jgi:hypothetical protein